MIVNTLLIKLKQRDTASIDKARDVLLGMKGKIDVLHDVRVEVDVRRGESSYDLLLITQFASMEDMETYLVHPVHVEVSGYIAGVIDSGAAVCYEEN